MWNVEREDETGTSPGEDHEQSFQRLVQNARHDGDIVLVQATHCFGCQIEQVLG
jgi:hypothetical protein